MADWILPILFFFVAVLYSSVGLGGGSSYTALMAIFGVNYLLIPTTSLMLNIVVASIGFYNYSRAGHFRWRIISPFLVTSIPLSYLAGSLEISKEIFYLLLLITLFIIILKIYFFQTSTVKIQLSKFGNLAFSLFLGCVLGFIAGAVGIGGGIYLVPLLIIFGLASEKEAAASGSVFILVNSIAGVVSRIQRGALDIEMLVPLVIAVIIGGYAGSHIGAWKLEPQRLQKVMGAIVVIAIILLTGKII